MAGDENVRCRGGKLLGGIKIKYVDSLAFVRIKGVKVNGLGYIG